MPDRRCGLLLCLAALSWTHVAIAQDIQTVKSDLAEKIEALQSASEAEKKLEKREARLRKELSGLQSDMVAIAGKIQRQEGVLSELEANLVNLEDEERAMTASLATREQELAVLVQSMLKLSKVPPGMVVAMPGDFMDTMRTAKVLGLTSNALSEQARGINRQLAEVKTLQDMIRRNLKLISRQKTELVQGQAALEKKLTARGRIQNQLLSRHEEKQAAIRRLSEESESLRDLMAQLETRRLNEARKAAKLAMVPTFKPNIPTTKPASSSLSPKKSAAFASAKGRISLPAEGKIFIFYGDTTEDGNESRGIRIRTRESAQVTSPYAGEVVYTGTFLDYGNMVIIRHENDYHSLLAGMARITAKLGQQVIEGEPVGEMGRTEEKTALYMEIRERNRPVDPIPWMKAQRLATR